MNTLQQDDLIIQSAKDVLKIESEQILLQYEKVGGVFVDIVMAISNCKGKLVISGMGKSGIIGKKISATFSSYGIQSFFLHPGEAYHGDLGMVGNNDLILLISNSGETDEILKLIPFFQHNGNTIVSMTGNPSSSLAANSTYTLDISIDKEACPLQLAPTASTTVTLAMGDAMAVATMKMKGVKEELFAKFHPGGSLGRKLLQRVKDQMITGEALPLVSPESSAIDTMHAISDGRLGMVVVSDESKKLLGIVTDGDIRRSSLAEKENFINLKAAELMTKNPVTTFEMERLMDAETKMDELRIHQLVVIDEQQKVVGILPYRTSINKNG
ncbi:MAG: KpsF/GutQ family sugar-phosphate isomerase [Balneolaceae bacterium]|nr:MAG: KpsF/GutQ family sugar-phosphate isomerase [Balneolaceae bacterium]